MKRSLEDTKDKKEDTENEEEDVDKEDGAEEEEEEEEEEGEDDHDDDDGQECPPPVQCWDNAVNVTDSLIHDAQILWECYGGDKTKAKSFWVSADAEPVCAVQALALQMADFHLQGEPYAGVEIWTQVRGAANPSLEFHFDKDEEAAAKQNVWKHPVVGTATYLSAGGGAPLVVFATASPEGDGEQPGEQQQDAAAAQGHNDDDSDDDDEKKPLAVSHPSKKPKADVEESTDDNNEGDDTSENRGPSHAWICYPIQGRHVAFAGNLLHGVAQELLFDTQQEDRLSLLVNIWLDHKPAAVEELREDVVKKLNRAVAGVFALQDSQDGRSEPLDAVELEAKEPWLTLREHVPGDTAPLPAKAIQIETEKEGVTSIIQISYPTISLSG